MILKSFLLLFLVLGVLQNGSAQPKPANALFVDADSGKTTISRHIYGHFSEHLGGCIYGGIWVGKESPIPNTRGIRNDVAAALRKIRIPNLRWPGGCFADTYHWMDGIGPASQRKKIVNTTWGGVTEDNSFGTHEFLDLCEQIGCEPVICGNIGSGTVKEMADWVEYITSDAETPMTELRKTNGREKPWKAEFWCIGNETWGCGGIMDAEFYSNEMARYSYFMKDQGKNVLYKIASGGLEDNYAWTETLMKKWSTAGGWLSSYMRGYSLHYYTVCHDWSRKGSATDFTEDDWFTTLSKTLRMEELISKHSAIMDKYDPEKKIGLIVDEWGNWHDVEPGTNPGFLYQQNTMRDAMVAAVNLHIFNKHAGRVKMANIAQLVNVLQSLILTRDEKMVLTPTYHVFDLYKVHHDATYLPMRLTSENYEHDGKQIPALSASASKTADGSVNISFVNLHPTKSISVSCSVAGFDSGKMDGTVLTSENMQDHNTFDRPERVVPRPFSKFKKTSGTITVELPSKSVVVLELKK